VKNAIKKLEKFAPKDLILSTLILVLITITYLFNLYPKTLKIKKNLSKEYIFTGKYHFNRMTLQEIDDLPNISHKLAKKIYENKKRIKNFDDFIKIKGIGKKKVEMLKKYMILR
jgi:DNA uptake protein ComE-like DNA-binding protein